MSHVQDPWGTKVGELKINENHGRAAAVGVITAMAGTLSPSLPTKTILMMVSNYADDLAKALLENVVLEKEGKNLPAIDELRMMSSFARVAKETTPYS